MKPSEIRMVPVNKVDINPYRNLHAYPVIPSKVEALKGSLTLNGMWPSIVARPAPNGKMQQAFGTHRMVAARELGLAEVPIIVSDLNDQQMIQYMAAENGEDYSTNFQIMLNTWEAGVEFCFRKHETSPEDVEVARLLGWTRPHPQRKVDMMNNVAYTCAKAVALIEADHLDRDDFVDMSTNTAREIVDRAASRMATIDQMAKLSHAKAKDIARAKSFLAKGTKKTAKDVREGKIAKQDIKSQIDLNTMRAADHTKEKPPLLFAAFGHKLAESINKMLAFDDNAEKLAEIAKVLHFVVDQSDKTILRQIGFELGELGVRTTEWRQRLTAPTHQEEAEVRQIGRVS